MKRAALVLAVALVGCGGSKPKQAPEKQKRDRVERASDQVDKALEDLKRSDLPPDLKKELEEAKRLLDEAK